MNYIIGIIGLVVFLLLAWVMSSDKKSVRWQYIGIMMTIQFLFAFLLLKTSGGIKLVEALATGFGYLLGYAEQGVNFVFGGLENPAVGKVPAASTFFMDVLLPITFISALNRNLAVLKDLTVYH